MAWGSSSEILSKTGSSGVTSTEVYSSAVTLNPGELAHVTVLGNNQASSATDDLTVNLYGDREGGGSPEWDTEPIWSQTLDTSSDTNNHRLSFPVTGLYQFRVGVVRDGSSDTIDVTIDSRKDGVSA